MVSLQMAAMADQFVPVSGGSGTPGATIKETVSCEAFGRGGKVLGGVKHNGFNFNCCAIKISSMNESAAQRKIIENHTKRGWLCAKLLQTTLNGIPDLMLLKAGRAVFIEVKRPGVKTAEPLQVYRHRQLRDLGFEVHLTDDPAFMVNEVKDIKKAKDIIEGEHILIAEPIEWGVPVIKADRTQPVGKMKAKPKKIKP